MARGPAEETLAGTDSDAASRSQGWPGLLSGPNVIRDRGTPRLR